MWVEQETRNNSTIHQERGSGKTTERNSWSVEFNPVCLLFHTWMLVLRHTDLIVCTLTKVRMRPDSIVINLDPALNLILSNFFDFFWLQSFTKSASWNRIQTRLSYQEPSLTESATMQVLLNVSLAWHVIPQYAISSALFNWHLKLIHTPIVNIVSSNIQFSLWYCFEVSLYHIQ